MVRMKNRSWMMPREPTKGAAKASASSGDDHHADERDAPVRVST